jgi:hypothetical protein
VTFSVWPTNASAANCWAPLSSVEAMFAESFPGHLTEHFPKAIHLVLIFMEVNNISKEYGDYAYFSVGRVVGYVEIAPVFGASAQPLTTLLALVLSKLPPSVTG